MICSWAPGRLMYQPNCLLLVQVESAAQQIVALVAMSRFCVLLSMVAVCACRFASVRVKGEASPVFVRVRLAYCALERPFQPAGLLAPGPRMPPSETLRFQSQTP